MALRRNPHQGPTVPSQKDIDRVIEKGGSIAVDEEEKDDEQRLQLRIGRKLVGRIDANLKRKFPRKETRPSRHTWFIEAFYEKLDREEKA